MMATRSEQACGSAFHTIALSNPIQLSRAQCNLCDTAQSRLPLQLCGKETLRVPQIAIFIQPVHISLPRESPI